MSKRWKVSAGVLDSGLASLATFVVGIFAIRTFEPAVLGNYALVFAAFNLAAVVPKQLIFLPAEIAAVAFPPSARIGLLPRTLRVGLLPALVSALLVALWSLAAPAGVPAHIVIAFTSTAVVCTFLSPVQDHVRRMLHVGGLSWHAALVSVVQVFAMGGTLAYMVYIDVPVAWIPLGSLAAANLLSLLVGAFFIRGGLPVVLTDERRLRFATLLRTGWWLLLGGMFAPASFFIASVIVTHLASAEALGYAEAARVVIRPLPVLAMGIAAVLRPISIEAAQKKQLSLARKASNLYMLLMGAFGLIYLAAAGFDTAWNPFARLLPTAYVVTGLAAASIVAEIVTVILFPYRYELLGGDRVVTLTWIEAAGGGLRSLMGFTAGVIHSFALPLGLVAAGVVRWVGYRSALNQVYMDSRTIAETERAPIADRLVPNTVLPESTTSGD